MSQQARSVFELSFVASGAVTYARAVNIIAPTTSGAYTAAQATVAGQKIVGIARRSAVSGEMFDATAFGTAVCEAGAAITVGARVAVDSVGRVITATALTIAAGAVAVTSAAANGAGTMAGGDAPQFVFGTALQAAAAAGDLIEVLIGN
ncbi:MAG: hypothetical protein RLY71_432 [Pseudomonadota bacterium]|jgi:hypothetical protein